MTLQEFISQNQRKPKPHYKTFH
uniref:Uncharacterized protein n=1 Tax=Anguilla anguilla TaxID=7936 RepID=A0A0E9W3D6_ANGAN